MNPVKHFMRAILPQKEYFNLFCFGEETADAIDDFVDANRKNLGENIILPKGESKEILLAFFERVKDQIGKVKTFRDNRRPSREVSTVAINTGWAYNVGMAWNEDFNSELARGSHKALLTFAKALAFECGNLDDLKDRLAEKREQREKSGE